jgi:hypothetical protein
MNELLDTTVRGPSITPGEAEMLLFELDRSRAQFAWKVGGLDAEALHRPHPPSVVTLAGLIKHLAWVEDWRVATFVTGPPWDTTASVPDDDWRSAAGDSPDEFYALWWGAVERAQAGWSRAIADGWLDQPLKYKNSSGQSPNLRRILVDLHDEYARHVGHANLFRESIDGWVGNAM